MRKGSGYATYTDKRHHWISADTLERKWGIGLDKAKNNLRYITQYNVRSSLKPLTRRYSTDLLLRRIHRLNCGFHMDKQFLKDKSVVGNTCAQIFKDEEFSDN